jgi:TATA-binding protein-associated factor Taf7
MSRSYRIAIKETLRRVIRAEDRVSTQLEILEVLPCDEMAELLAQELEKRGFERKGDQVVREENGVRVSVDPKTGTVTVSSESAHEVDLEQQKEGRAWDDVGPNAKQVREQLREQAKADLEKKAEEKTSALQTEVTDKLEKQLGDLRRELDQAVNRVTAEALKRKAAQMGQIKEMSEDPQTGSLTIVVEV